MGIVITVLSILVAALIGAVVLLYRRLVKLSDDVVNMRYIKVEKQPDGGWSLKTRDGQPIFDL